MCLATIAAFTASDIPRAIVFFLHSSEGPCENKVTFEEKTSEDMPRLYNFPFLLNCKSSIFAPGPILLLLNSHLVETHRVPGVDGTIGGCGGGVVWKRNSGIGLDLGCLQEYLLIGHL